MAADRETVGNACLFNIRFTAEYVAKLFVALR